MNKRLKTSFWNQEESRLRAGWHSVHHHLVAISTRENRCAGERSHTHAFRTERRIEKGDDFCDQKPEYAGSLSPLRSGGTHIDRACRARNSDTGMQSDRRRTITPSGHRRHQEILGNSRRCGEQRGCRCGGQPIHGGWHLHVARCPRDRRTPPARRLG